jgi:hypothetical protein
MKIIPSKKTESSEIFILLSGKAEMVPLYKFTSFYFNFTSFMQSRRGGSTYGSDKKCFRHGSVVGSLTVFDSEANDDADAGEIVIAVTRGSLLKLKYSDYYIAKYDLKHVEVKSEEETLLDEIKACAEKKIPGNLSTLLRKYNMVPDGVNPKTSLYVAQGSAGRRLYMKDMTGSNVIIVLQGVIRILLDRSMFRDDNDEESNGSGGSITCLRKGGETAHFKVQ